MERNKYDICVTQYLSRLIDVYLFAYNLIGYGLNDSIKQRMYDGLNRGLEETVYNYKFYKKGTSLEEIKKIGDAAIDRIKKENFKRIEKYEKWICNHSVVMMCGIFEEFMINALESILDVDQNYCKWKTKEEIIKEFKSSGMKSKIDILKKRLKLSDSDFFDLSFIKDDRKNEFKDFNIYVIANIFENKRHPSAHSDQIVVNNLDELNEIKEKLEKVVFIFSKNLRDKFGLKVDLLSQI